jgi:hypothetical protein
MHGSCAKFLADLSPDLQRILAHGEHNKLDLMWTQYDACV